MVLVTHNFEGDTCDLTVMDHKTFLLIITDEISSEQTRQLFVSQTRGVKGINQEGRGERLECLPLPKFCKLTDNNFNKFKLYLLVYLAFVSHNLCHYFYTQLLTILT